MPWDEPNSTCGSGTFKPESPLALPYPHADGIFRTAVSDDAMQVATASRDGHVRVFDVPRESRSLEELRQLSGIYAGVTLDELDNEEVVDAATIEDSWNVLSAKYPDQFRVSADERNAWFRHRFRGRIQQRRLRSRS